MDALDEATFLGLLEKLIGETRELQNRPPDLVPKEDLAGRHVLHLLEPYAREGGPLRIRQVRYAENRGNIIVEFPGTGDGVVSFVGSHMDVVYANAEAWERDPFTLIRDGDMLYGRGTTDCLGHVALLTTMIHQLCRAGARPAKTLFFVFIVNEEAGNSDDVGVDRLMREGELEMMKGGPVYWVDCADKQPNVGSGGLAQWRLTARGRLAHSGFPHNGVNALELASEAVAFVQRRFYDAFPPHDLEAKYGFECSSSLKPTRINVPESSLNQIPGRCVVEGDIRLIPFYPIERAVDVVDAAVSELRAARFAQLPTRGPDSKFDAEGAELELEWMSRPTRGLACDLESDGYKALARATAEVLGKCQHIADTGTLPLVGDLREMGMDLQTIGYGVEDAYHADNEYARLSDYADGFKVFMRLLVHLRAMPELAPSEGALAESTQ